MATQVQFRRGTTTETNLFTGAVGEVTVDTTKNVCVVHDGSTSGGFPLLRQDGTNSLLSSGSLSSPSLKFSNSITTGIYSPSPGSISIVNNGVANLTIDSSGAVNIPGNFLLSGNLSLPQGTVTSPSLKIGPGTQGFYSPTTEQLAISIDSTRRAVFTTTTFRWGAPTGDCGIEIGLGATADRAAFLDFVGDTTYTDYGLRLIRNGFGPNANSNLIHRGTGGLVLITQEAGPITFNTTALERARIDSSGRLLVGTSSSSTYLTGITATLQSIESSGTALALGLERPAADSSGANIGFRKTRSTTPGGVGIVLSGDQIGQLRFIATDGANPIQAAGIQSVVDGTPGLNDMPGRLVFTTTPVGSATPVERMRIGSTGVVAIGSTNTAGGASGSVLRLGGDITGATSTAATLSTPTVRSGVTAGAIVFASQPSVEDVAFTCGDLTHFRALQSTIGATATVTNQIGFLAHSSIIGATNNYGFYGNIPSGTGRFNFYAAGTADSYFASNNFIFANGGTERARFDSVGRLLVGTSANIAGGSVQIYGSNPFDAIRYAAASPGPTCQIGKSRSATVGVNAIVLSGDTLGNLVFSGDDGSSFVQAAAISAAVDGTPGLNDMPGRLVFSTTADGSSTPTEQWRINNGGTVIYNQPAPAAINTTATLTVANLTAKIITSTTAAAVTMTLPLGTDMDTGFSGTYTNMAFEWAVINTGATNAVTIQANTGHTIVGSATVAASNSGRFLCRRTAANTWVTYRLSS